MDSVDLIPEIMTFAKSKVYLTQAAKVEPEIGDEKAGMRILSQNGENEDFPKKLGKVRRIIIIIISNIDIVPARSTK